ncbi:hypothetical protein PR202_ga05313 [Eleusine coracana subsp. coracana]|uniref:Uncharacterized protein n=1 Tax=Eleusine coracana subsp. coracana TaxID=191504 RepID=A0AAV5BQN3_ELECO|nr:hypothetical protein PR202_ga04860 [Eleusine coracana subsp. coracana]GJM89157.1 hypothetical protein PR202_ga05313 [Eleusine coracana subsp. coracana]
MYMVMPAADATTPAPTPSPAATAPTERRRDHVHAPIRTSRLAPSHPPAGIAARPESRGTGEQARQFRPPLLQLQRWRVSQPPGVPPQAAAETAAAAVPGRRPSAWE